MHIRLEFAIGLLFVASTAKAAVPNAFSVQGVLRDNMGKLQSMMVNVTVSLYDAQTNGNKLGGPYGPNPVMANNGLLTLSITDPNLQTGLSGASQVWLEMTVGSDTFARQPVAPQLFALLCGTADVAMKLPGVTVSNGNVGLGTTAPKALLHLEGQAGRESGVQLSFGDYQHYLYVRSNLGNVLVIDANGDTDVNSKNGSGVIAFYTGQGSNIGGTGASTEKMRISANGNVGIGTGDPSYALDVPNGQVHAQNVTTTSDIRLKTDIHTLENALAGVAALRGVRFKWKKDGQPSIGVVAQELQKVYPELVSTAADGTKSVQYGNLSAVLIEAVKQLRNENAALKARLDSIEARIDRRAAR